MARHEFGIMQKSPKSKDQFNSYEPEKYNCIFIHDNFIEPIIIEL